MIPKKAIAPAVLTLLLVAARVALIWTDTSRIRLPVGDGTLGDFVRVALIVAAGITLVRLISDGVFSALFRRRTGREAPALIRLVVAIVGYAALFVAVFVYVLGQELSGLLATSAVVSVVIGLALQDTLGNFFAGVSLHVDQPYQIGDKIRLEDGGLVGRIESVSWRTTSVRTNDNSVIVFPNNYLARHPVVVFPLDTVTRERVPFPGPLATPPQKVIRTITEAVRSVPGLSPTRDPVVRILEYAESRVIYEVLYWVTDHMKTPRISAEIRQRIWYAFERAGVPTPYPVEHVRVERRRVEGEAGDFGDLIGAMRLFEPLSDDERAQVVESLAPQIFAPGELIIGQGDDGESMFVIARGEAEVSVRGSGGEARHVAVLGPGDFFGEMALFTGEPRTADVRAATEAVFVEIRRPVMERLLAANEALADALSRGVAERQAELAELNRADAADATEPATIFARMKKFFRLS